jgi:hypothetical protein
LGCSINAGHGSADLPKKLAETLIKGIWRISVKYIRIATSILILFAGAFNAGSETVKKDFQNFGKESRLEDL